MPREKRKWYEGACYHVMGRGNRRSAIFKDREDNMFFMFLLKSIQERYPFKLHAYCLMTNHFHLELTTGSHPIWKIMQPLMNNYSRRDQCLTLWNFNKRMNTCWRGNQGCIFRANWPFITDDLTTFNGASDHSSRRPDHCPPFRQTWQSASAR